MFSPAVPLARRSKPSYAAMCGCVRRVCCASDQVDWSYPRGADLLDPTREQLGDYYGRLLSYLTTGTMVDEHGHTITGGPQYDIDVWEVFNEPDTCRNLNASECVRASKPCLPFSPRRLSSL